jgi:hypothetical protein
MAYKEVLKKYNDEIGSATAILGLFVGVVGFGLTIFQLSDTKRALQASNAYQIQRDARDLIDEITSSTVVQRFLNGDSLTDVESSELKRNFWKMNNFYLAVFRQGQSGGLPTDFAAMFGSDFCSFSQGKKVQELWQEMLSEKMIGKAHTDMLEVWCK